MDNSIIQSLLHHCLQLLSSNNKQLLRDSVCDILDILDNGLYDIEDEDEDEDIDENRVLNNTDDNIDDTVSVDSDDVPFTDTELAFIKNKAHANYLLKYSLKPTFLHQYWKSFMEDCENNAT
jgi:hypothetical protein